jgi:hypothetical protein
MTNWNLVAMGQTGLTGWTAKAAGPIARSIAGRTGRPEPEILALIGAVFLAISLIDFLRTVDNVITAGRTATNPRIAANSAAQVGDRAGVLRKERIS